MTSSSTARPSLHALTGLRFFAALHVVAFHVVPREGLPSWAISLLDGGPSSVTLFFILSGFVLAYSHLGAADTGRVSRRDFWAARFARIYPVYLLGLVLAAPPFFLAVLRQEGGASTQALQRLASVGTAVFTLTQAWAPSLACQWNCPGWSLSVEAVFYALFPLLALPVARARPLGLAALALATVLVGVLTASAAWGLDGWLAAHPDSLLGASETWRHVGAYHPVPRLAQFLLGVVMGRGFALRQAHGQARPVPAGLPFATVALALGVMLPPWTEATLPLRDALLTPLFAGLIWALAHGAGPLARFLEHPVTVRLGEASFALYILHIPLAYYARVADRLVGLGIERASPPLFCALSVAATLVVSLAVFLKVEEPARRWLRARLTPPRPSASVAPGTG
ncbi:acyltransferase [Myxococcaceae bacterium JPH2]|nr:acyltransferase [Myxococcaceae bacterium JPH2]